MALVTAPGLHAAEFVPLFNGKDLTGWDGDPRFWSVQKGILRGETSFTALPLANTFLIWRGATPKDFELRLQFRIQSGNSGVQYRSRQVGKWVVAGYQAEIENTPGKAGLLYEEKGRKFLARVGESVETDPAGQRKVLQKTVTKSAYKLNDWNQYWIIARGPHIEHWLNGIKTIQFTDNDPAHRSLEGLLALQIHAGPPMVVEFKDILLKAN